MQPPNDPRQAQTPPNWPQYPPEQWQPQQQPPPEPLVPEIVVKTYPSPREFGQDAPLMASLGFQIVGQSNTPTHQNARRSALRGMLPGGKLVWGQSLTHGAVTVTWQRMVPLSMLQSPTASGRRGSNQQGVSQGRSITQDIGRYPKTAAALLAGVLLLIAVSAYRTPSGAYTSYPTATINRLATANVAVLVANPTLDAAATSNAAEYATGTAAVATINRGTVLASTPTALASRTVATPDATSLAAATKVQASLATGTVGTAVAAASPPCPDSACAAKPGQKVAVIVSDGANLRAAPNAGAMVLTLIPSNAVATVAEQGAVKGDGGVGWVHVAYEGQTGFVRADLLSGPDAPITRGPAANVATVASDRTTALARNAGQSVEDYMREGFRTTSWYPYITGYRVSSTRIDVVTSLSSQEASKRTANNIRGAVFSYVFDTNPTITFVSVRSATGSALCEGIPGKSGPCY